MEKETEEKEQDGEDVPSMFSVRCSIFDVFKNFIGKHRTSNIEHRTLNTTFYTLSLVAFILALLSKTSTVVLPVVFLLCAWWRDGRVSRTVIRAASPYFIFALAAGVTILIAHYIFGAKNLPTEHLLPRLLGGAKALWFYLGKTFLPINLTMNYPRWEMNPSSIVSYLPVVGLAVLFAIFWRFRQGTPRQSEAHDIPKVEVGRVTPCAPGLAKHESGARGATRPTLKFSRGWGRACLFGLGYYIFALAPTLGIFKMTFLSYSQVADHFQFLALPGLIALVVGGIFSCSGTGVSPVRIETHRRNACATAESLVHRFNAGTILVSSFLLLLVVPLLAWQSWEHQKTLRNRDTLWSDNIKKNPKSWLARYDLASEFQARGQLGEAEKLYRQAIELRPDYLAALSNLGAVLGRMNRWPEAMDCYDRALTIDPTAAKSHFNLGTALLSQNKLAEAVVSLSKAVELDPKDSTFQNNLASALIKTGNQTDAVSHAREAIRLNPANDEAQANLGLILFQSGKIQEAGEQFRNALRLNPANVLAHLRFAMLLTTLHKDDDALSHLAIVLQSQPGNILAHTGMADILARRGKTNEAAAHQAALKFLRGQQALNKGQADEAKESFRQALKLDGAATVSFAERICSPSTPNALSHLDLLASLCAEEHQVANTMNVLHKIIRLAEISGETAVLAKYRDYLEQYQRSIGRPGLR